MFDFVKFPWAKSCSTKNRPGLEGWLKKLWSQRFESPNLKNLIRSWFSQPNQISACMVLQSGGWMSFFPVVFFCSCYGKADLVRISLRNGFQLNCQLIHAPILVGMDRFQRNFLELPLNLPEKRNTAELCPSAKIRKETPRFRLLMGFFKSKEWIRLFFWDDFAIM